MNIAYIVLLTILVIAAALGLAFIIGEILKWLSDLRGSDEDE